MFYGKQTSPQDILETLGMLVEGGRISSIHWVKGVKADTILDWFREAAEHAEQVEAGWMNNYQVGRAQMDGR